LVLLKIWQKRKIKEFYCFVILITNWTFCVQNKKVRSKFIVNFDRTYYVKA